VIFIHASNLLVNFLLPPCLLLRLLLLLLLLLLLRLRPLLLLLTFLLLSPPPTGPQRRDSEVFDVLAKRGRDLCTEVVPGSEADGG